MPRPSSGSPTSSSSRRQPTRSGTSRSGGVRCSTSGAASPSRTESGLSSWARPPAPAATRTAVRLICTAIRSHDPVDNAALAEAAVTFRDRGLSGFDLAGPEEAFPDPLLHERAFAIARDGGLRITVHASEWGRAAQVRRALELNPERIAHGPGGADDPEVQAQLRDQNVTLDLCPTSNVQAGIVASVEDHPLALLHRAGVPVTLSTDDSTVSDISLSDEYERAITRIGLTLPELWTIDRHALDVAFAEPDVLAPIRDQFDAWAATIPEVQLLSSTRPGGP